MKWKCEGCSMPCIVNNKYKVAPYRCMYDYENANWECITKKKKVSLAAGDVMPGDLFKKRPSGGVHLITSMDKGLAIIVCGRSMPFWKEVECDE